MDSFAKVGHEVRLEAVITRKDGTVEDLGCIAFYHPNPLRRLAWRISRWLRGSAAGRINIIRS